MKLQDQEKIRMKGNENLFLSTDEEFQKRVRIHGTDPLLDTPVLWLSENFSYPDNFLHLVICDL